MKWNKVLELTALKVWPVLRLLVRKSKRCQRCILSEKCTTLKNGICEECLNYQPKAEDSEDKLDSLEAQFQELLSQLSNQKSKYHALFLLSGGKDSAYVLNRFRNEYPKLKILCLFVDNGFSSEYAYKNAVYITQKLNVDLIVSRDQIPTFRNNFKNAFLNLGTTGGSGVVDKADGDKIFDIGREIAAQLGIAHIINGLSYVQIQTIFNCYDFRLKTSDNVTSFIFPLYIWRTNENLIRDYVIKNKLILKGSDNPVVSNNDLIITMSAVDVMRMGYCSFEPEFAKMIREGKALRTPWLHNFELLEFVTRKGILNKEIDKNLGRVGLSRKEVLKTEVSELVLNHA